ncbi:hypothetical protein [Aliihoeflea sp. PC F10.4]
MMAVTSMSVSVRFRWWFWPLFWLVVAFAWSVGWAVGDDDDRLDDWLDARMTFLAQRGIRFDVSTTQGE